jgi:predicted N-acetyltransferase YhbS
MEADVFDQINAASSHEDALTAIRSIAAERGPEASNCVERHLRQARYRPELTYAMWAGSELAGYALIDHRRLRVGVATVDTGMLADLYVRPPWREQGIFESLVGAYLGILYEQDLPLALVAGPAALFGPYGFAPFLFDAHLISGTGSAVSTAERSPATGEVLIAESSYSVASVSTVAETDLEDLAALYEAATATLPHAEFRTPADWQRQDLAGVLALRDRAGRVVAYAREVAAEDGQSLVVEGGAVDAAAARALLAALAHGTPMLALPPLHPLAQAALQRGGTLTLRAATNDPQTPVLLAGVVDLPALLTTLVPEFARRLERSHYAGWSGAVRLELATGRATLLATGGALSVVDGTRPADVRLRRVTLPALAQLLLGYRSAGDLRATAELDCDDIALGLLDALFPLMMGCGIAETLRA